MSYKYRYGYVRTCTHMDLYNLMCNSHVKCTVYRLTTGTGTYPLGHTLSGTDCPHHHRKSPCASCQSSFPTP